MTNRATIKVPCYVPVLPVLAATADPDGRGFTATEVVERSRAHPVDILFLLPDLMKAGLLNLVSSRNEGALERRYLLTEAGRQVLSIEMQVLNELTETVPDFEGDAKWLL